MGVYIKKELKCLSVTVVDVFSARVSSRGLVIAEE